MFITLATTRAQCWPSTDQYRSILTLYHQVSSNKAFYGPISTKDQPVPPYTDLVPTSTAQYWSNTSKYQQVLSPADPVLIWKN